MYGQIHVLGPQDPTPNVADAIKIHCPPGPIAVISAGWRYDEDDIGALTRDIDREVYHLPLYEWFDELGAAEPELSGLHRMRRKQILAYKKIYHIQLQAALETWEKVRKLHRSKPNLYAQDELLACQHIQEIDRTCLQRLDQIRADFTAIQQPWLHESVLPVFEEIAFTLSRCKAVVITGGHVAILRNRLSFFGIQNLLHEFIDDGNQIYAWSAGAMALTNRIILYHDDPPWKKGYPEIMDYGLGLLDQVVFFPHATTRLELSDPHRIERLARRFAPDSCICLENGAHLLFTEFGLEDLSKKRSSFRLSLEGTKLAVENV